MNTLVGTITQIRRVKNKKNAQKYRSVPSLDSIVLQNTKKYTYTETFRKMDKRNSL